jgi:hypothetical protein
MPSLVGRAPGLGSAPAVVADEALRLLRRVLPIGAAAAGLRCLAPAAPRAVEVLAGPSPASRATSCGGVPSGGRVIVINY